MCCNSRQVEYAHYSQPKISKLLLRSVITYINETWTNKKETLRRSDRMYGQLKKNFEWRIGNNQVIDELFKRKKIRNI